VREPPLHKGALILFVATRYLPLCARGLMKLVWNLQRAPFAGGEHFVLVPSNTVQVCTNPSLLCVKGGGLCAAKLGGIVSRYFHFANTSYRWLYNPPVSATRIQPPLLGGPFLFECITPPPDGATQWIHREPSRLHTHKTDCASSSACATTWCIS